MSRLQITTELHRYLEGSFPNPAVVLTTTTPLLDEWFLDSLSILDMVLFLETTFCVELSRADINATDFHSIETLCELVRRKMVH